MGNNSRLDEIQAGLLGVKLPHLERMNKERRRIAKIYSDSIKNTKVTVPYVIDDCVPVWHIYGLRCKERDALETHLNNHGIGTNKHYPIPIHLQECYRELGYVEGDFPVAEEISRTELSLPMYYGITDEQVKYVVNCINSF